MQEVICMVDDKITFPFILYLLLYRLLVNKKASLLLVFTLKSMLLIQFILPWLLKVLQLDNYHLETVLTLAISVALLLHQGLGLACKSAINNIYVCRPQQATSRRNLEI